MKKHLLAPSTSSPALKLVSFLNFNVHMASVDTTSSTWIILLFYVISFFSSLKPQHKKHLPKEDFLAVPTLTICPQPIILYHIILSLFL